MFRHILIPTDGSALSQEAIEHGMRFAKSINAKVTAVSVTTPFQTYALDPDIATATPEEYERREARAAAKHLDAAKHAATAAGVSCKTVHVVHDQPYRAIIDTAAQLGCDLIFMASHGRRGIAAVVLGSETVKVLTHSTIPVLVLRAPRPARLSVET